jgi:hypothetical protein
MGLDISAFSHLHFVKKDIPEDWDEDESLVPIYRAAEGIADRLDGCPPGLYARTTDANLWWHAEHGTHAIPSSEVAAIDARIARLRAGEAKAECPGDLAVLEEVRPVTQSHGFRAGSYSGYNWWREQLSKFGLDRTPESVWSNKRLAGSPFVELIDFSDCEGSIGPQTSAKLFDDFLAYEDQVAGWAQHAIPEEDNRSYFVETYADWQRAFELAADFGFVIFH